jgi:fumarylacetoacetase
MLNETHAVAARSWVDSANVTDVDFPIQNLPFCAFQQGRKKTKLGVGIGDQILDLSACAQAGLLSELSPKVIQALKRSNLNDFMSLGRDTWRKTRSHLFSLLLSSGELANRAKAKQRDILVPQSDVRLVMPMTIGDFTDFECSHHHSTRMRRLMSGATKPLANGHYLPRAYHGRASSVVVSGEPIYLPRGQIEGPNEIPTYKECVKLDYELELGIVIGTGNKRGHTIPIDEAEEHIFGFCIVNDWSARDVQHWERLPLGPFLGKNHATTISPWIVTMEAMAPFRAPQSHPGEEGWPEPLPYLDSARNRAQGGLDVGVHILLTTAKMRERGDPPYQVSSNRFLDAHWTISQMVTQHTCGGCNLKTGDLFGSGTISGIEDTASACLMELSENGTKFMDLPSGEKRSFLQVGDEVTFIGASKKPGYPRIGFGECKGQVVKPLPVSK